MTHISWPPLSGDSTMQPSYTQKRTVKRILIRVWVPMVTLPKFTQLDYAHMCAFVCATATYRLLPGSRCGQYVCTQINNILKRVSPFTHPSLFCSQWPAVHSIPPPPIHSLQVVYRANRACILLPLYCVQYLQSNYYQQFKLW
jgi:hypothetical protein